MHAQRLYEKDNENVEKQTKSMYILRLLSKCKLIQLSQFGRSMLPACPYKQNKRTSSFFPVTQVSRPDFSSPV